MGGSLSKKTLRSMVKDPDAPRPKKNAAGAAIRVTKKPRNGRKTRRDIDVT